MSTQEPNQITRLLESAGNGDVSAKRQLWSVIYDELHRLAQQQMRNEPAGRTMQPTALVHEAYLRLFREEDIKWANRRHFFGAAAQAMRRIRIEDARRVRGLKRGGDRRRVDLDCAPPMFDQDPTEVLAVDEALDELEKVDPRKAKVVMFRYFAGLTEEETARAIDVSRRTVQNDWQVARAWLHRALSKGDTAEAAR